MTPNTISITPIPIPMAPSQYGDPCRDARSRVTGLGCPHNRFPPARLSQGKTIRLMKLDPQAPSSFQVKVNVVFAAVANSANGDDSALAAYHAQPRKVAAANTASVIDVNSDGVLVHVVVQCFFYLEFHCACARALIVELARLCTDSRVVSLPPVGRPRKAPDRSSRTGAPLSVPPARGRNQGAHCRPFTKRRHTHDR